MPYNFSAESFHTKKLCSRLSSKEVHFYTEDGHFAFLSPLGGLRATYAVHPRLIGTPVMDLLLAIFELFSLGVRPEALRVHIDWKCPFFEVGRGSVLSKISGRRGRPPPTILRARKLHEMAFHMV